MAYEHDESLNPSGFLQENIDLLPGGKVLDVAMGRGRNAIYLAGKGFEVEGVDISEEVVKAAQEAAENAGATIITRVADLEAGYRIQKAGFDVIICFNYLQRSLMPGIKNGIKTGGLIIYETFIVDQAQFGSPRNPDYLLKHNELLDMFRDFRCLRYHEGIIDGRKAVAGIVARKE